VEKLQVRMILMMTHHPHGTLEDSHHLPPSIRLRSLITSHNVQFRTNRANFKHQWKHTYFCKLPQRCLSFSLIHTAISFFFKRHTLLHLIYDCWKSSKGSRIGGEAEGSIRQSPSPMHKYDIIQTRNTHLPPQKRKKDEEI
jgi:hypothetical protein